ncbi:MAG TPA: DUF167 domain-containing protein [Gemmatimonadales bacterium]|nr:DUF167 domain-containing protein [Gemmatimonadales bacterium]
MAADEALGGLTATLLLHVVPRARVTALAGRHGDALKIRLAAPPVDGAANDELIRFLAERLAVPRSAVTIAAGHTSRRKTVTVTGIETAAALRALETK